MYQPTHNTDQSAKMRRILPCRTVLQILVLFCLGHVSAQITDTRPLWVTEDLGPDMKSFSDSMQPLDYHELLLDEQRDLIYIGARGRIYSRRLSNLGQPTQQNIQESLQWESLEQDKDLCGFKGKDKEKECHNFIRVLLFAGQDSLFVCGTNAADPKCAYVPRNLAITVEELRRRSAPGNSICPFDPKQRATATFVGDALFSAEFSDFTASLPLISRRPANLTSTVPRVLTTVKDRDSKWFNEPEFVSVYAPPNPPTPLDEKVYFFFREVAVEHAIVGRAVYSRVAQVCKNDQGGTTHYLGGFFTTFLKARIDCSIPGNVPFYFDEIQGTFVFDEGGREVIYGVFTTPENSVLGSAVCVYSISDIRQLFSMGQFKRKMADSLAWTRVMQSEVPDPRPGKCLRCNSTCDQYEDTYKFARSTPLMDPSLRQLPEQEGQPLLSKLGVRFTQLVVHRTRTSNGIFNVLFIGTDNGTLYKSVEQVVSNPSGPRSAQLVQQINVFPATQEKITTLKLSKEKKAIYIGSNSGVRMLPLHNCGAYTSCVACVSARDPYCGWSRSQARCTAVDMDSDQSLLQDVLMGDALRQGCRCEAGSGSKRRRWRGNGDSPRPQHNVTHGSDLYVSCSPDDTVDITDVRWTGPDSLLSRAIRKDSYIILRQVETSGEITCARKENGCEMTTVHRINIQVDENSARCTLESDMCVNMLAQQQKACCLLESAQNVLLNCSAKMTVTSFNRLLPRACQVRAPLGTQPEDPSQQACCLTFDDLPVSKPAARNVQAGSSAWKGIAVTLMVLIILAILVALFLMWKKNKIQVPCDGEDNNVEEKPHKSSDRKYFPKGPRWSIKRLLSRSEADGTDARVKWQRPNGTTQETIDEDDNVSNVVEANKNFNASNNKIPEQQALMRELNRSLKRADDSPQVVRESLMPIDNSKLDELEAMVASLDKEGSPSTNRDHSKGLVSSDSMHSITLDMPDNGDTSEA
ncbi:semaphorin-1A-like isoform X1 [Branchiostoma floridae]|uniref:Semaphorin-1A-like isoform X1 n=1 Tax=Branchiostoma floridae TaxID=7739 RepID=A0A9J7HQG1_BRAFL|nr:semaphorin-1A-like isoform X1 [Branchiostoma floridae]XP_035663601.1 semaphorin-1A-like isoform X1 [Branchiostoma floridae]